MNKIGKILIGFMGTLVIFVLLINVLAGIVGGIWLLFLGQWWWVLIAIIYYFIGHYILGIVLLGGLIFGGPSLHFSIKNNMSQLSHLQYSVKYSQLLLFTFR